jgi:hypothetical protein
MYFFEPRKQQSIELLPDSTIVGASALVPKSKAAKKKKSSSKSKPPFGPVQAIAMGSDLSGGRGGDTAGYGNTNYGKNIYGESINGSIKKLMIPFESIDLFNDIE